MSLGRNSGKGTDDNGAPGVTRTPGPELQAHGFILNDAEAILEMKRGTEVMPLLWVYCSTKKTPFSPQSFHDPAPYHCEGDDFSRAAGETTFKRL
ncbi:MAG: hypothetical protein DMG09_23640 [Acidobacteria bacterium]|nr:MAG: hypothetical protein DMG09_23640 [Acidobacteriota bacterium]